MDFVYVFIALLAAFMIFKVGYWFIGTVVKFTFLIAFIALGVLAMSSSVGLL